METTDHMTIIFIFKQTYQPDLQAISARATEDQIRIALQNWNAASLLFLYMH